MPLVSARTFRVAASRDDGLPRFESCGLHDLSCVDERYRVGDRICRRSRTE